MKKKRLRAFEATVYLGQGLSISSFLVEGKTVRYGTECVSLLVGHARNYLGRLIPDEDDFPDDTKKLPKKLEALHSKGFTGYKIAVTAPRPNGGATNADTLSLDDFAIFVEHEAVEEKNPKAIALLTSAFKELLRGRTQQAFGLPEDDIETKQADFSASFYEREAIWAENREDVDNQIMLGDEGLNIAEYDTSAAQWENNLLYSKYFVDAA
jgi:hypothetical protein